MFANVLKAAMDDAGMKACQLSAVTGIGASSISMYLKGAVDPPAKKKEQIALALGLGKNFFSDMFSDRLKEVMDETGTTPGSLSAITGISVATISRYMSGDSQPSDIKKERLAVALGLPNNYFLEGEKGTLARTGRHKLNLPVQTAAMLMGKSNQFVYMGLQQGVFPWGYAVRMGGDKWSYYISPKRFMECTGCKIPEFPALEDESDDLEECN